MGHSWNAPRTPYHGHHHWPTDSAIPHDPGTHHHHGPCTGAVMTACMVVQGRERPARLLLDTVTDLTYLLQKNHHFLTLVFRTCKNGTFQEFDRLRVQKFTILPFYHLLTVFPLFGPFSGHLCFNGFSVVFTVSDTSGFLGAFRQNLIVYWNSLKKTGKCHL